MTTGLGKLIKANRWRIRTGKYASDETAGFNGHFLVPMEGELWHVRICDRMDWKHVSVMNARKAILPHWSVTNQIKHAFFGDDEWAVQFYPAKGNYISDSQWCVHIWVPLEEKLPIPHFTYEIE